ncbi:hypothetical protein [Haloplasma contractile]|uniref:Membrane lipoprotein n=1 Tax=Haloplasma contractile SSD-17B TaxID=1033810 RepID=U2FIS0_9MOLU|nr:hypothetical protein [Haloplasma contractile]ERJ11144.1 membrane lipoprotein [Haloplasma contractile SSD-17B]
MKNILRKVSAMLVLTTVLVLGGCDELIEALPSSDETFLKETYDNQSEIFNLEMSYSITMESNDLDLDQDLEMTIQADMENENEGVMAMDMNIEGMPIETYFEFANGDVVFYMGMELLGQSIWMKDTTTVDDFYEEDKSVNNDPFFAGLNDFIAYEKVEETTWTDGTSIRVYDITVNNTDFYTEIFGELELDTANIFGLTRSQIQSIFEEITYRVHIDEDDKLIRKVEMDITEQMNQLLAAESELGDDIQMDEVTIVMEISKIGEIDIVIPDEAYSAEESDLFQ